MNRKKNLHKLIVLWIIPIFLSSACTDRKENYIPKPRGYFRIEVPEHQFQKLDTTLPFGLKYSQSANYSFISKEEGKYWIDITYPALNATLNMTYIPLNNDLRKLALEEEKMINFHIEHGKADDVQFHYIDDPIHKVYGRLYDIEGRTVAIPLQFWISDSSRHYLRASLHFNFAPDNDSLQPVIQFLREDVLEMINSMYWK